MSNVEANLNKISVSGFVSAIDEFECYDEEFYLIEMDVKRQSGVFDELVCEVSKLLLDNVLVGDFLTIHGEVRTRNELGADGKRHVKTYVFAREVSLETNADEFLNDFEFDGYVCRDTELRETPLGKEICNIVIANNRKIGSSYLHCITWNRTARRTAQYSVGTKVKCRGRLQSREYEKVVNGVTQTKTAHEISIHSIEVIADE